MESALKSHQDCQKPVVNNIPPNQPNKEVKEDLNAVQKTQVKDTESSTEPQPETVPEASPAQSNVSIDMIQLSHVTGTKPF